MKRTLLQFLLLPQVSRQNQSGLLLIIKKKTGNVGYFRDTQKGTGGGEGGRLKDFFSSQILQNMQKSLRYLFVSLTKARSAKKL